MHIKAASKAVEAVLQWASEGNVEKLQGVNQDSLIRYRCKSGCSALHWATGSNQLQAVRYLVEERGIDVNIRANKKAKGRTPLHYACRNGHLELAKVLVQQLGADSDARAKHNVSPFQLAVWQNHLSVCQFLVLEEHVDASQLNDFDCGAIHWIGLCPFDKADGPEQQGELLIPTAEWLGTLDGINFRIKQRQGHTALHKAAWGGHIALLQWLKDKAGLMDGDQDLAGNFAADLADMANTERHSKVARFLRHECSIDRANAFDMLGVSHHATEAEIRQAYLGRAKELHPDRTTEGTLHDFDNLREAYELVTNDAGLHSTKARQSNPSHSLRLMLELNTANASDKTLEKNIDIEDPGHFKARLLAVLLEYGNRGLDASNISKKWDQVWPNTPRPWEKADTKKRRGVMLEYIRQNAGDVVNVVNSEEGGTLIIPKNITQEKVALAAARGD